LGALLLGACGGKEEEDSATVDTAIGGTTLADAPVLSGCDSVCRLNTGGGPGYTFFQWQASCFYEDPQGSETVQPTGDLRVEQNGAVIANLLIVCGPRGDGSYQCTGNFAADDIGASCQIEPESYTFIYTAYDIDGNLGTAQSQGRAEG
jgi:hypothetical protein